MAEQNGSERMMMIKKLSFFRAGRRLWGNNLGLET